MKRLLKISFDLALSSIVPVLSWFILSIILDKNLINVFTLTYPIQFIYYILKSIFSTGANINKEKDKNEHAVMSGLLTGIIVSIIIFSLIILNINTYISLMNMDIKIYKIFTIYSVSLIFFQTILSFVLGKLYYEEKNKTANIYTIIFNFINSFVLIGLSLITKNQLLITSITLLILLVFTIYILFKQFNKFKYKINIIKWIKYDSVDLCNSIFLLIVYLFGFSNTFDFGPEYATALTFATLITDTQWDTTYAISTTAQIDISKKRFNYIEHQKNAYKLISILLGTILLMFITLCWFYNLNYILTIKYLLFDIIHLAILPLYILKICYLQIEWSAIKTTVSELSASFIRTIISFLKSPFCTGIGQLTSAIFQLFTINIIFDKKYIITKDGFIKTKCNIIEENN